MENTITVTSILDGSILANIVSIIQDLKKGVSTIANIVEYLEPVLTSSDAEHRIKGIQIITKILQLSPRNLFTSEELTHISSYYILRLNDHHSLYSTVLAGMLALADMVHLPESSVKDFLRGIFSNIQCQQQVQKDRLIFYSLMWMLLKCRPIDVKKMEYEFILGFMDSVQGERDPKCLVIIFKMFCDVKQVLSDNHFTDELFEIFAAYFPIDFSAQVAENVPYTRQGLSNLLKVCLTLTPKFSKYTLPLLIEKMDSDLETAKLDSLDLLDFSINTFPPEDYIPYFNTLFLALQQDAMWSSKKVRTKALIVLHHITKFLCSKENKFIDTALEASFSYLSDSETSTYQNAINILLVMSRTNPLHCSYIANKTLHTILQLPTTHSTLLSIKCLLLSIVDSKSNLHVENRDRIINILNDVFKTSDNKKTNEGIAILTLLSGIVDIPNSISLYETILSSLRNMTSNTMQESCITSFGVLADTMPKRVRTDILSFVIPKEDMPLGKIEENVAILCRISFSSNFMEECVSLLVYLALHTNIDISSTTLHTLRKYILLPNLENWKHWMHMLTQGFNLHGRLIAWIDSQYTECDEKILNVIVDILSNITVHLWDDQLHTFIGMQDFLNWHEKHVTIALTKIVKLKRTTIIPRLEEIVNAAVTCSLEWPDEKINRANQLIFTLINKTTDDVILQTILNNIELKIEPVRISDAKYTKSILLCAWIGKALLLRSHKRASEWIAKLICRTSHLDMSLLSSVVSILCCDFILYDGNVRYLYKQHLLTIVQSLDFNKIDHLRKLIILNRIFKLVPASVLNMNNEMVVNTLKQSTLTDDDRVIKLLVDVMIKIFLMPPGATLELLINEMESFLPKLLYFAKKTTLGARSCIASLIVGLYSDKGPMHTRVRLQSQILMELRPLLNSPLRCERVMAYVAIDRWSVLENDEM